MRPDSFQFGVICLNNIEALIVELVTDEQFVGRLLDRLECLQPSAVKLLKPIIGR